MRASLSWAKSPSTRAWRSAAIPAIRSCTSIRIRRLPRPTRLWPRLSCTSWKDWDSRKNYRACSSEGDARVQTERSFLSGLAVLLGGSLVDVDLDEVAGCLGQLLVS